MAEGVIALLDQLRARGVKVVTDGRRLGVVPAGSLTPEERDALRRFKPELVRLLTTPEPLPALDAKTLIEVLGASPTSAEISSRTKSAPASSGRAPSWFGASPWPSGLRSMRWPGFSARGRPGSHVSAGEPGESVPQVSGSFWPGGALPWYSPRPLPGKVTAL